MIIKKEYLNNHLAAQAAMVLVNNYGLEAVRCNGYEVTVNYELNVNEYSVLKDCGYSLVSGAPVAPVSNFGSFWLLAHRKIKRQRPLI